MNGDDLFEACEICIPFYIKKPKQIPGWSAGFLLSLAALQMGTLVFVRKSSDEEVSRLKMRTNLAKTFSKIPENLEYNRKTSDTTNLSYPKLFFGTADAQHMHSMAGSSREAFVRRFSICLRRLCGS